MYKRQRYKCLVCPDYDLCSTCEAVTPRLHPHVFAKLDDVASLSRSAPAPAPAASSCCTRGAPKASEAPPQSTPFKVAFVAHESLPTNSVVGASESTFKLWKVKNVGEQAWPADTALQFLSGDRVGQWRVQNVFGDEVPVGAERIVCLQIEAPPVAGDVKGTWALTTASGQQFTGDRLTVEFLCTKLD